MSVCKHQDTHCLNQYELVRKYRCISCSGIMMCACDRSIGERFLPHQLSHGKDLETQQRIPVTLGFVAKACELCRTGKATAYPMAAIHGRTSKIKRYYWRELAFRKMELYEQLTGSPDGYLDEHPNEHSDSHKKADAQALEDIKNLHAQSPRYVYDDESAEAVLKECRVRIRDVHVEYATSSDPKARVRHGGQDLHVEQFAQAYYSGLGYHTLLCESIPFHVIFGVFTWILIQDPDDPFCRTASFGERSAYERDRSKEIISTSLPSDFGTPGYSVRRAKQIASHLNSLNEGADNIAWLFDYWLEPSWGLRQYLWAHRDDDIVTARQVVATIPGATLIRIVEYLLGAYWDRFLGWPDILATQDGELLFIEVKSSADKFSEEQKHWMRENFRGLHLPFEVLKLHRLSKHGT